MEKHSEVLINFPVMISLYPCLPVSRTTSKILFSVLLTIACTSLNNVQGQERVGSHVRELKKRGSFSKEYHLFSLSDHSKYPVITQTLSHSTILLLNPDTSEILRAKPDYIKVNVPVENGARFFNLLLYRVDISANGFRFLTSNGSQLPVNNSIIHYRGIIENDEHSLVSMTISGTDIMASISNGEGNYVLGKIENDPLGAHVIYLDKNFIKKPAIICGTNTSAPGVTSVIENTAQRETEALATKCVNWYWETDYDLYVNKGSSLSNVTTYIQGIFNQVQTLYANDGMSITLKTLFVWTDVDPYTGATTSNYLNQFGAYRTSFDGDLATLIGLQGNGGIAWINGFCSSPAYKMAYCGISASYNTVPSYSWTVEVIAHEEGHLFGSRHTHDCVWNGNNTEIDGCGDAAGYKSGSCATAPLPSGGGTIMSYCHLTAVGINFTLGFGPQPGTLMRNNVSAASCLSNCGGCTVPAQPGSISGAVSSCQGSSQTYSVTAVPGATGYTWTLPPGWTGSSTSNSISVTTGSSGGNISVTANNSCGSSALRSLAVTITGLPGTPGTVSGPISICPSTTNIYSIAAVSGATSYTWTLPSVWSGSSTTTSISATSNNNGGTISVKANNSCGSGSLQTLAVSVSSAIPSQPGIITGLGIACQGSLQTYSVLPVIGANSYTWNLPSGWSGTSTTNSILVTTGSTNGTISVIANNSCGSSPAQTLSVSVSLVPAQPGSVSGSTTICPNTTNTYFVPAVAGALNYTWTLPSGWTGSSTTNSISVTANTNGGPISVTANNACGTGSAQTLAVTVSAIAPAQPGAISGSIAVCPGSVNTYSIAAVNGAVDYTWTIPPGGGWSGNSNSTSLTVTAGSSPGSITVNANNSCGSGPTQSLFVSTSGSISQPGPISGNTVVCQGTIQTYSVALVAGADSYIWTLPSGWSGTSTSNSISTTVGSVNGNISVAVSASCGISSATLLPVSVDKTPGTPASIVVSGGSAAVCPGESRTYSTTAVVGMTYIWSAPTGAIISSGQGANTILINFTSAFTSSGTLSVRASNTCGTSGARNLTISRNIPAAPGTITMSGGIPKVCPGDSRTYSINDLPGLSYVWTIPPGAVILSGQGTGTVVVSFNSNFASSGNIKVAATNGCGTGNTSSITVYRNTPAQPSTIAVSGGSSKVCPGDVRTYSVVSVAGINYDWETPAGATISSGQGTNAVVVAFNSGFVSAGSIKVTPVNNCGEGTSRSLTISLNSPATPGGISGANNVCPGEVEVYSISPVQYANSYAWTIPVNASIIGASNGTSIIVQWGSNAGTISVRSQNGCGISGARSTNVNMNCTGGIENLPSIIPAAIAYPNPTDGSFTLKYYSQSATEYKFTITDMNGRIIRTENQQSAPGVNYHPFNLGNLSQGIYFVRLTSTNKNEIVKLMVE